MTRRKKKADEREHAETLLAWWSEKSWEIVAGREEPDFLFRRGEEIVGIEFTSGADSSLAHAERESHKIAEEWQTELTSRGITSLHVYLAFVETSALSVGAGKQRIRNIVTLADSIERRLPLGEDGVVEKNPEKEGVHFLSAFSVGHGELVGVEARRTVARSAEHRSRSGQESQKISARNQLPPYEHRAHHQIQCYQAQPLRSPKRTRVRAQQDRRHLTDSGKRIHAHISIPSRRRPTSKNGWQYLNRPELGRRDRHRSAEHHEHEGRYLPEIN